MKRRNWSYQPLSRFAGITLVELMIVVGIVALLALMAIPNYTQYGRKAQRTEAQRMLMNWGNLQEVWRASNPTYAGTANIPAPTHGKYTFAVTATQSTYLLTATARGDQLKDKQGNTLCTPMTLDAAGEKLPAACWSKF